MSNADIKYCFIVLTLWVGASSTALAADIALTTESPLSTNQHIMVLAGSCAACHGTNGNALAGNKILAGMPAQEFITKILEFKNDKRTSTVMHRHAKGLTEAEIEQLALHFSAQHPQPAQLPKRVPPQGR